MRKISYLLLIAVVAFSACKQNFKKAKDGTEYMVIPAKGGKLIADGNIMAIDILVKYKDSTLNDTYAEGMPQYAPYDTAHMPPLYKEVFKNLHVGDSIIIKMSTDSLIKQGQAAPFMQKGQIITANYKISNAYATQQEADSARKIAMVSAEAIAKVKADAQLKKDDQTLTDYFKKNNIKAIKAPQGAYVEILAPGTGSNIDTSMVAQAKYAGRVLGKTVVFDSNTDSSKGHTEPLAVNMTDDQSLGQPLIKGMLDGFSLLNKGAKARLYIPSSLGYGPRAGGPDLPANSILVFDVEVLNVMNKAQAKADVEQKNQQMEAMQKRYMDSARKAQSATATPGN